MTDRISWTDPETWQVRHETKKKIKIDSDFFSNKTDMSYYDCLLEYPEYHKENKGVCGTIELMTPDDYIATCVKIRTRPSTIETEIRSVSQSLIDKYYQRSLRGEKMPIPVIDENMCSQEGRHRAMVSKRLGLEKIPVLVVRDC